MASKRLLSLDILRGITISGMIMVNNPGSWGHIYAPLKHAAWNGCTPTDLVFPFFMFIMGVSMYISYNKYNFDLSKDTFIKVLRRGILIFAIGLGLNLFSITCRTIMNDTLVSLADKATYIVENLRILGVLQRLALVSFFGTIALLLLKPQRLLWFIGVTLTLYAVSLVATNSLELSETSILAVIDTFILGSSHLYKINGIAFDPEGLFSTIPCIPHVLIGAFAGKLLLTKDDNFSKINSLFIFGTIILFIGFLVDYITPLNKIVWSSSFVLVTCGLASLLLAILIWIIDIRGYKGKAVTFFESFGVNPLFIFVFAGVFATLLGTFGFNYNGTFITIKGYIYTHLLTPAFGNYIGSLIWAIGFITICWAIAHILYKKKIYIKI